MILSLTGRDRVKFLHNLCTNDLYKLATGRDGQSFGKRPKEDFSVTPSGRSCMAAALNRQGKMIAVFRVWMLADELLLETDEPALEAHLKAAVIMDKVTVAQTARWSTDYVAKPCGIGIEAPSPPFRDGRVVLLDVLDRSSASDVRRCRELALPDAPSYDSECIASGWPRWGVEMDSSMLPMEAGLDPIAVSYTKGCYLGQEVIQRVRTYSEPPRELKQLHFEEPVSIETAVTADGEKVGEIRSASRNLALALMKKSHARDGTRVDGAIVRNLPWHSWT